MEVVLDANILASGAVAPSGGPLASVVDGWQAGLFGVVLSVPILDELERALGDTYFTKRLSAEDIASYLVLVRATTRIVSLRVEVHDVATHPEDDLVLSTAVLAGADCLV